MVRVRIHRLRPLNSTPPPPPPPRSCGAGCSPWRGQEAVSCASEVLWVVCGPLLSSAIPSALGSQKALVLTNSWHSLQDSAWRSACHNNQRCPRLRHPGLFYLEVSGIFCNSFTHHPAGLWAQNGGKFTQMRVSLAPWAGVHWPHSDHPPSKEPSLGWKDDRSVFGVAFRGPHYLPVAHWLAGMRLERTLGGVSWGTALAKHLGTLHTLHW
jgi:hypothetical protein